MSTPVVLEFLAETDDMLAGAGTVEQSVQDMIGATQRTISAVEALVQQVAKDMLATAQASTEAFEAQATGIAARFKAIEEAATGIIGSIQTTAEAVSSAVMPIVDQVRGAYEGLKEQVESTAKKAAVGFAALGAGTLVAGGAALQAGQSYEDLRARLQGLTGDVEVANALFREAVDFAASTPFGVGEIVSATAQLKAFGQTGAENLKLVAEIAAASGQPLEETALRVGKAMAGISEGFQGLRDTSGITTERLVKYGAVMNSAGGISVKTAGEIAKAKAALLELGRAEFSGNIERQSATYTGALSNAGDAVQNFKAVIGNELIPIASLAVRGFSALVGAATSVVSVFAPIIPVVGAAALGISAVGLAVSTAATFFAGYIARALLLQGAIAGVNLVLGKFGLSLGIVGTQIKTLALGNTFLAASFVRIQAAATLATGGFAAMRASMLAAAPILASFTPAGIIAVGVGVLAARLAFDRMEKSAKAAGDQVKAAGAAFQSAATGFRRVNDIFKDADGKGLTFGATVRESADEAKKALDGLSDIEIANIVEQNGQSLESLSSKLKENATRSDQTKKRLAELREELEKAKEAAADTERRGFAPSEEEVTRIEDAERELRAVNEQFQNLGRESAALRVLVDRLSEFSPALVQAAADASRLDGFLKFANGLEAVDQLHAAIGEVDVAIADAGRSLQTAFGTTDRFQLGLKLADPDVAKNEQAVKAIEAYLGLLDQRDGLEQKIAKSEEEAAKKSEEAAKQKIKDYELVTAKKKALGELTLQEERARIEAELAMVEEGSAEEVRLLEQLAAKDKEISERREQLAQNALNKRVGAIEEAVSNVSEAPGAKAEDVSAALREAITSLESFGRAQKDAFANAPEAAEAFRLKVAELKRELADSDQKGLEESLSALKKELEDGIDTNGTTAQQLVQVGQAITSLKAAMASKTVDQAGGEEYLTELEDKKLDLIRQQTQEKLKQADEVAALQAAALDQEIQILEARKAAGENVEAELAAANAERVQMQLDSIDQVLQAEIEAGADRELAEQKAALKREAIYNREALTKYQAAEKADKDIEQLGRRRGRGQGSSGGSATSNFQPSFRPGPSSSSPTLFSGFQTFALPDFAEGFGRRIIRDAPRAPRFDAVYRQTTQDIQARQGSSSSSAPSKTINDNRKADVTVSMDGLTVAKLKASAEAANWVWSIVEDKVRDEGYRK